MPCVGGAVFPMNVAMVAVEGTAYHYDRLFSYRIPEPLREAALPGARVLVPFGSGKRPRQGFVLGLAEEEPDGAYKPLFRVLDQTPPVAPDLLPLAVWLKERCFCTFYEAMRLMVPAGLNLRLTKEYELCPEFREADSFLLDGDEARAVALLRKKKGGVVRSRLLKQLGLGEESALPERLVRRGVLLERDAACAKAGEAFVTLLRLAAPKEETPALTPKQSRVADVLAEQGSATLKEICYTAGVSQATVRTMLSRGVLEQYEKRVYRSPCGAVPAGPAAAITLSPRQQEVYETLLAKYRSGKAAAALLYGVTGSGKTSVFMKLIGDVLAAGRDVVVLVPEISLTPQAVSRFVSRFGSQVAVLHSGLSLGERLDEWERVRDGRARIVVGTRSAVFAPVKKLGLIVLDEEQETTYKSGRPPRYHARDVARFRCAKAGALMLLSSATPSVESFYAAKTGRYDLLRLDERYGGAELPDVIVVDMKRELEEGVTSDLSRRLCREIAQNIQSGQQSILLLNRRGYNTFVECADCGATLTCPQCSIALTYHAANGRLMCHYCGYSAAPAKACPQCGSPRLRYGGAGTQKLEQELGEALPGARILRMDTDTTLAKFSHEKILGRVADGECDVLIGTQMVAKGLDFPKVTLVGVLSADAMLNLNDFRAGERAFSLLAQVVGRAGRGALHGRAVIQTKNPENIIIRLAALQDYDAFYGQEIRLRRALLYPPFCDLCEIGFTGVSGKDVSEGASAFAGMLAEARKNQQRMPLRVLGPSPATVAKLNGRFRYKILLKCRDTKPFRAMMAALLTQYGRSREGRRAAAFVDMNPLDIL